VGFTAVEIIRNTEISDPEPQAKVLRMHFRDFGWNATPCLTAPQRALK
jgi:hypothetical protein